MEQQVGARGEGSKGVIRSSSGVVQALHFGVRQGFTRPKEADDAAQLKPLMPTAHHRQIQDTISFIIVLTVKYFLEELGQGRYRCVN